MKKNNIKISVLAVNTMNEMFKEKIKETQGKDDSQIVYIDAYMEFKELLEQIEII